ncbi:SEC-C metal-binding domain-containing protein [Alteriqipengyuania sp. 357]
MARGGECAAVAIKGGQIELLEKLGRNDPCPCGSGKRFQTLLPAHGPL